MNVCVCTCAHRCMCHRVHAGSEDNFQELALSYIVDLGDQYQALGFANQSFDPLRHLIGSIFFSEYQILLYSFVTQKYSFIKIF